MRLYYEVALRAFRRATVYRTAYLSGLITNAFFGAMLSYVYLGVYGSHGSMAGMSPHDAVSYLWAAQAMISVGGGWLFSDLAIDIRNGNVAVDLMRPWNYYAYWLSQQLGERAFNLLLRGSLTYVVGVLYFGARVPEAQDVPGVVLALCLSMLISCAYTFAANVTAFWLIDNSGLLLIANILLMFFSGFLIPLAFFPPLLGAVARALPFQAITGLPVQVFLGQLRGEALAQTLLLQLGWTVALTALALVLMRWAMQKVIIQGG